MTGSRNLTADNKGNDSRPVFAQHRRSILYGRTETAYHNGEFSRLWRHELNSGKNTAMTGTLDTPALALFLIVFFWQVPHFLAIAWMYREDYGRAGLKMLPVIDADGTMTARQMLVYTLALIPISLLPVFLGSASAMYGFGALGLGVSFLRSVWAFAAEPSHGKARKVLHASLVYLPVILAVMVGERLVRYFFV